HANKCLAALRGVLRAAWQMQLMSTDDWQRTADITKVPGESTKAGHSIEPAELEALLATTRGDPSPAGRRDTAILAVLYITGLRRAELSQLDLADWDPTASELTVTGKGNRKRMSSVPGGARRALDSWLDERESQPGPLFQALSRGGRCLGARLSPEAVGSVVTRRAKEAGIDTALRSHDFRRTLVGDLLDTGADVVTVAAVVGHSKVTTTQGYDRRPDRSRRQAVERLERLRLSNDEDRPADVRVFIGDNGVEVSGARGLIVEIATGTGITRHELGIGENPPSSERRARARGAGRFG
nr:tyrosine-type recombinase/integrase [Actinomycetota bacterium]